VAAEGAEGAAPDLARARGGDNNAAFTPTSTRRSGARGTSVSEA